MQVATKIYLKMSEAFTYYDLEGESNDDLAKAVFGDVYQLLWPEYLIDKGSHELPTELMIEEIKKANIKFTAADTDADLQYFGKVLPCGPVNVLFSDEQISELGLDQEELTKRVERVFAKIIRRTDIPVVDMSSGRAIAA